MNQDKLVFKPNFIAVVLFLFLIKSFVNLVALKLTGEGSGSGICAGSVSYVTILGNILFAVVMAYLFRKIFEIRVSDTITVGWDLINKPKKTMIELNEHFKVKETGKSVVIEQGRNKVRFLRLLYPSQDIQALMKRINNLTIKST